MNVTKSEFQAAKRRPEATLRGATHATHVHYDRKRDRIVIALCTGIEVACSNDVLVDGRDLVYLTDRIQGLSIIERV